jgi:hypothetical protein
MMRMMMKKMNLKMAMMKSCSETKDMFGKKVQVRGILRIA